MNRCTFRCLKDQVLIADLIWSGLSEPAQTQEAYELLKKDFEGLLREYKGQFTWILLSMKDGDVLRGPEIHIMMDVFRECNLKLIDVPASLYEVIIQSGIYGRFEVLKKLRRIDCTQLAKVGEGYTSKVYVYGEGKILKAFASEMPLDQILEEREKSRYLFMSGARAPISYELVKTHEGYGVVFENLGKTSLAEAIMDEQADHHELALKYGELIRQTAVSVGRGGMSILPSQKKVFMQAVYDCEDLVTPEQFERICAELKKVPNTSRLIHGDSHVENIMITAGHLFLIDAMTLAYGHPVFDLLCPYMCFYIWPEYKAIYDARRPEDEKAHPAWYGYISRYANSVVSREEGEQLWKDFLHGYFGEREEDFYKKVTTTVRILNEIKFGCYYIRKYIPQDMMWGYNNWAMTHFDQEEGIPEDVFKEWN